MPRVVVLGGGIAGLTAAHELAERGFDVVVLERRHAVGGKARSLYGAPHIVGPGAERYHESTRPWAPGEHGFRFFPGFYKHVIDSMRRIPVGDGRTAADGLVATTEVGLSRYDHPTLKLPARFPRSPVELRTALGTVLGGIGPRTDLTLEELGFFATKIWRILTSCAERRLAELEPVSWWDFIEAERRSPAYRKLLGVGNTRSLVAAQADKASARTVGDMFVQLALAVFDPLAVDLDRVLDGPTTDVWLDPWRTLLKELGVRLRTDTEVTAIHSAAGRVRGVEVRHPGGTELVVGDYYVCAVPIERAAALMTPALMAADPLLAGLPTLALNVEWMTGIQFYLFDDVPMLPGHMIHIDSEWALTSISQVQFWRPDWYDRYLGDEEFDGIVSVDISDWESPGSNGRAATDCTPEEVAAEVWSQLKRSVNEVGAAPLLTDENLAGWLLDPSVHPDAASPGGLTNLEPLLVNYVGTWAQRPEATTAIPNLFLAGDYVRTHTDLATMEGANEAARAAVNAILDAAGHPGERCSIWPLVEPPAFEVFRAYDSARFSVGLPWDSSLCDVAVAALSAAGPELAVLSEAIAVVGPAVDEVIPATGPSAPTHAPPMHAPPRHAAVEGPSGFAERLAWYRERTVAALAEALPSDEPARHLYAPMHEYVARPSKGLRPALLLATAAAYGGCPALALPSAAGLELLHNAFLVHDDVEDAGLRRRGGPAMHRTIGTPLAVNAGDAMQALAMRLFRGNLETLGPEPTVAIVGEVDHLLLETLEGQAMELGWIRDNDCYVGVEDYLRLVLKKTAWYSFIHPMRMGAIIAKACENLDRFNRFGFLLGAAFQIQDDVLNLVGIESRYGKQIGGDLLEGKRTLVLAHAFSHGAPPDVEFLRGFLARSGRPRLEREVARVWDVLDRVGSIGWARGAAADLAAAAARELPIAYAGANDGPDLDLIRSLVDYVVQRDV